MRYLQFYRSRISTTAPVLIFKLFFQQVIVAEYQDADCGCSLLKKKQLEANRSVLPTLADKVTMATSHEIASRILNQNENSLSSANQSCSPVLTNRNSPSISSNQNGAKTSFSCNQNPAKLSTTNEINVSKRSKSRLLVKGIRASGIESVASSSLDAASRSAVVRLELDEPRQVRQTKPAYGVTNPYWDEHFVLELNPNSTQLTVSLQRHQRQSQLASACLSLASVPPGGARVLLPLPQSGSVTMELLALPSLPDEDKPPEDSTVASKEFSSSDESSSPLSQQVAEFMRPLPETPQRPKRLSDRLSCADADCQGERRQISDYSYAKRFRDKVTMEFQMSYKRRNASRSRSIADKISRALQVHRSAQ
ncbi:hypothetical protein BOX15_Mlig015589g1 [Macrostomum lignano]|uniref:C2 domain-containing protein n=1 Tax=Macrostomum lignano TaxID=282301 RepID=A0A267GRH7_9PLAT|nr:hypothetical protein BOX15_Mlig015589g1 [Macrostomum lignano]